MALATAVVISLVGCSRSPQGAGGKISVVASFFPIYEAARRVGGGRVQVTNLTPTGAEPHDLELSPKHVDEILDARVVLYMGLGFQPAVEETVRERGDGITTDLLAALSSQLRKLQGEGALPGGADPHVWLDPVLMADLVLEVRDALTRADPAGGAIYLRNADAYRSEVVGLDGRFRSGLHDCARRVIVTSHAAFGYLASRYGLRQEAISGLSPEAEPDPKRLAQLTDLVRRERVTTIFTEELVSPSVANTLAREAGVRTAVLNPLEGLTAEEIARGEGYVSVMEQNLRTLRAALGCR